jgi:hypothetical protein
MITLLVEGGCVLGTIDINGFWESRGMVAVIKGKSYTFGLNVDFDGLSLLFWFGKEFSTHVDVLYRIETNHYLQQVIKQPLRPTDHSPYTSLSG